MNSPCLVISKGYLEMEFSVFSVLVWVYFYFKLEAKYVWIIFRPRDLFQNLTKDYPKNKISQASLVTFLSKYKTRHLCWKNTMLSQENYGYTINLWGKCFQSGIQQWLQLSHSLYAPNFGTDLLWLLQVLLLFFGFVFLYQCEIDASYCLFRYAFLE